MSWNAGRAIYRIHKWLGLFTGLFLIVIGLTGSILVFMEEIDNALNEDLIRVTPQSRRVSYDLMLENVKSRFPDANVYGFRMLPSEPDLSYTVAMDVNGDYTFVHLNPYTGEILGSRVRNYSFVYFVLVLHYSLWFKPWGELVVGLLGITLFLSGATGLYIYRRALLNVFRTGVRTGKGMRIFLSDLHRFTGVLTVLFNVALAVTGFYMMLYAFSPTYLLANEKEEKRIGRFTHPSVDLLMNKSRSVIDGFTPKGINLPIKEDDPVRVYGHVPVSNFLLESDYGSHIYFDQKSGAVIKRLDVREASWIEKMETIFQTIHFGQYGGLLIKIIYFIGGLSPGILSFTGIFLWLRRRKKASISTQEYVLTGTSFEKA
jgi:uncharacterized iron-regulated membrane protein